MASKSAKGGLEVKPQNRNGRSPSRSPGHRNRKKAAASKKLDYSSEGISDYDVLQLPVSDYKTVLLLTAVSVVVRLFRIYQPTSVVFDEVHFGGFATKYINGNFFMDVHPPLAKMLIALVGYLAGFRGDFDFKEIGKDYLEPGVPYVAMRMLPAIMGIMAVPTMFLTLKAYGCRTSTASMGALLVTFENGLVTQSRFILLDSPLIIFTALTALAFTNFTNQHEQGPSRAFGASWWFWLTLTGIFLGATVSVKWVGLFTIAWVGSLTLVQLWVLLGDTRTVTVRVWFKHFFARAFCLIVIPVGFYMAMFAIHFLCLSNPGDGDGFMSSEFQATLSSKKMQDVPADVAFGSRVTIRHHNTQGGYLHSHNSMYPEGSKQQQITLYPHKDENNIWIMENQTQPLGEYGEIEGPSAWDNLTANHVIDGSVIKLYHTSTQRRLHSHDVRPPVTEEEWQNEVSAYGYEGFAGDANDLFRVEIVRSMSDGDEAQKRIRTIQTKFKLVHVMTGCVLFSHKVKLPAWGFEQQEVTCAKGGSLPNSIWYVEQNDHPMLGPDAEKVNYKLPGFLGKFWELQKVMWTTNAGLLDSHAWDSRPPSWPTLLRGINFWSREHRQIYLMGNPLIWWSSTTAIIAYVIFKAIATLRWQRSCHDYKNVTFKRFDYEIGQTVLGWAFHYFPFYLMARQLFLHHYFPSLYFAILAFCQVIDYGVNRISLSGMVSSKRVIGKIFMVLFVVLSIVTFTMLSPLAYGNPWTKAACRRAKLLDSWDFDCGLFHNDLADYQKASFVGGTTQSVQAIPTPESQQQQQKVVDQAEGGDNAALVTPRQNLASTHLDSVVYRDQHGNILNEEQVAMLEKNGNVSFETRYETKTRIIDAQGREVNGEQLAPYHPDAEGQNPETAGQGGMVGEVPINKPASVPGDEKSVEREDDGKPRPASEGNEATKKDEGN
ncbi:dolichyl-phosphate-mannose-protein mannosyltransferase [Histoplasma capsulatum var. duboisii H88]|uniref:Dolichyl-phosphate-mannose--protein mannosyltransferase n=2 Tax=Ajellomyces capsulatus TaxID=5037 RepID=F0UPW3_AJEC8|nr:dolichyl-phosphate-mannose-protein mannosyltransferase [Histoplasma capsulatum H143]EGC47858.1 dolichyl-phosphate-mannose-protein mannosyltransferase [Histoplasma capsulatum var. duboisii H88]QSS54009.1 dolichyl-phosphate-mannose-protein mannosyltransferase [Histoplasma capsulatum var. duboisii H88]